MSERTESNKIKLCGTRISDFEFSHEIYGEKFYRCFVECARTSGNIDTLPVIVPSIYIEEQPLRVKIDGEIRTRNVIGDDGRTHLDISVFAKDLRECEGADSDIFEGQGYICKSPVYRETPLGREITDVLVAFNRTYGKSDYIPCVTWGRNAHRLADCEVGTPLNVKGRLQSRVYHKTIGEEVFERVAYELSLSVVDIVEK